MTTDIKGMIEDAHASGISKCLVSCCSVIEQNVLMLRKKAGLPGGGTMVLPSLPCTTSSDIDDMLSTCLAEQTNTRLLRNKSFLGYVDSSIPGQDDVTREFVFLVDNTKSRVTIDSNSYDGYEWVSRSQVALDIPKPLQTLLLNAIDSD